MSYSTIGSTVRRPALGLSWLLLMLVFALACASSESAPTPTSVPDTTKRILVVHSYSTAFPLTKELNDGIIEGLSREGLARGRDYVLETFFMDTRVNFTKPDQIEQRAAEALEMLRAFSPDILFVSDDNALKDVAIKYVEENAGVPLPTVFAGINIDPTVYTPINSLDSPGGSITGVLERIPYAKAFEVGKRLFPGATTVVILGDRALSSEVVRGTFERDYPETGDRPLEVLDFLLLKTFDEWKSAVLDYQEKVDVIAVLDFHQLEDDSGEVVPAQDVVRWMVEANKLPELGLVSDWAEQGILVAVGNSGFKTGAYVGALGADILNGEDPATFPIVDPQVIDVKFNLERARTLGIEFPPDELASAAEVYETIGEE